MKPSQIDRLQRPLQVQNWTTNTTGHERFVSVPPSLDVISVLARSCSVVRKKAAMATVRSF